MKVGEGGPRKEPRGLGVSLFVNKKLIFTISDSRRKTEIVEICKKRCRFMRD